MTTEKPFGSSINDKPNKVETIVCNCDLLWSLAHQFSYLRLSDKVGENEYKFINLYHSRAKRIAATYARFYLEEEEGGDYSKIGRYYWMALGAFASKTVACGLNHFSVKASYALSIKSIANGLAQGNLWLFIDISASHWFYNNYREHFHKGMTCESKRSKVKLEKKIKKITEDLPWASKSIQAIKSFVPSEYIKEGFKNIKKIEDNINKDNDAVADYQMKSLMAIANHEQIHILQKLIYDDLDFSNWMKNGRSWWGYLFTPEFKLVFSHKCETNFPVIESIAPKDMEIEDFQSRMTWIDMAAKKFHLLMSSKNEYMIKELKTIASWVDEPDGTLVY